MISKLTCCQASGYPRDIDSIASHIHVPNFAVLTRRFLYDQLYPVARFPAESVPHNRLPEIETTISIYHSAVATFYAPSDPSGLHGMYRERLRCTPNWRHSGPRYDCAFVVEDQDKAGFEGLSVVHLHLLFSFKHSGHYYPCALVEWFVKAQTTRDADTGLWMVKPDLRGVHKRPFMSVIHLDCLLRGAHLMPVFGPQFKLMPDNFQFQRSLDTFQTFYVNQYIDHHTHELLSSPL